MLKKLQRRILVEILEHIPSHPSAHGFVKGRSVLSNAQPHTNQRLVLRLDLAKFFPSITLARVRAIFRTAGYAEPIAEILAGLTTTSCPPRVIASAPCFARALYAARHLPQGAPTSPALANLCAYRLDVRLSGLAARFGARYTRYADDLTFSGGKGFDDSLARFTRLAAQVIEEEGFDLNPAKVRAMRQGQRQSVAGVVVNSHPNVPRREFDALKAILTNCARHGPASQNRENIPDLRGHLAGRIGFVEMVNLDRGAKLRALWRQIDWQR